MSDFAIGGALMQDDHPTAYESRKLNDTERKTLYNARKGDDGGSPLLAYMETLFVGQSIHGEDRQRGYELFQTQKKLSQSRLVGKTS